jgi:uncharacterized protein YndB with AHSA1/START domain
MELGKARNENITVHEVRRELELPADRHEAWEAVADPERLGEWLGGDAEIDLTPGGDLTIGDRIGFVEEVEPGERLAFWWRLPDDNISTRVEIELDDGEDGTVVRVIETSPLATLDLVGIPLPSRGTPGPTALALA